MSTIIIVKVTTTTPTKTTRITDKVNKTITTTIMEARILMVTEIIKDNIIITITATTTRAISQDQRATAGKITADPNRILDHLTMTRAETTINLSRNNSTNKSNNLNTFLLEL